ncbi:MULTISPECIES: cupin domain-containing protein [Streptomyces]|uniref:Cupin domain-containing protein n=1 Tax=Streptomyces tricolor TaxID=68277 RepID=A0ABS9JNC2_9ACTN|nr:MULTISPECIES: cupin domain-containing protein [Streptomyces]MYU27281.1 cupin domain-containing protein [Streptomyces sp. SID7810]CUW26127.1 Cupin domain protein [Streptomyces reticuli]AKN74270.1 cupin [Streptomyces sp. PBH53]MCE0448001.1 cupin domain-containing protein [Streptomyces tricolor]MCG0067056.1 cupin domain-containing protein [Streptomyces tricolor]
MTLVDVRSTAARLPDAWSSHLLGRAGGAGVKVLRMDGRPLAPESHDTAEALLVLDGTLRLHAGGTDVDVRAGQMYVVAAGVEHAVRAGSRGTLVIVGQV